jgi:hypothetical protein
VLCYRRWVVTGKNGFGLNVNAIFASGICMCSVGNYMKNYKTCQSSGSHCGEHKDYDLLGLALCSFVGVDGRFRGAYCLHHQGDHRVPLKWPQAIRNLFPSYYFHSWLL